MSRFTQRRQFLRHGAALTGLAASPWALNLAQLGSAEAATTTDYKALVCIFLAGGNDAHNTVVPTDAVSWRCYAGTRDPVLRAQLAGTSLSSSDASTSLALPQSSLLSITHANKAGLNTGRTFGLHPQLKQIKQLYASGKAAIVANVGPLLAPMAKVDALDPSFPIPAKLYSHNDQTWTWQSFQPEGASGGWGGRLMDSLAASNANAVFTAVGAGGSGVWLSGNTVAPFQIGAAGTVTMGGESGTIMGNATLHQAVRIVANMTPSTADPFAADLARVTTRALSAELILKSALSSAFMAPWGTPGASSQASDPLLKYTNPNTGASTLNPLAAQLQMVARMIAARTNSRVGAMRQVFLVQLGGFDTHSNQLTQHADLLAKLDHAVGYFYNALGAMPDGVNMRSMVTTFTASEFGRALMNNGDGTDHGWGGHHFVIGDAVKGADVYGTYPQFLAFDGAGEFFSNDLLTGGVLLPNLSLDQYVYTLGKWMGVAEANLLSVCPNIQNFASTSRNIGFLG